MKPKTKKRKLEKSKLREQRRIKNRKNEREIFKEQQKTRQKGFTIRGKTIVEKESEQKS
jgi:hypothetical protein